MPPRNKEIAIAEPAIAAPVDDDPTQIIIAQSHAQDGKDALSRARAEFGLPDPLAIQPAQPGQPAPAGQAPAAAAPPQAPAAPSQQPPIQQPPADPTQAVTIPAGESHFKRIAGVLTKVPGETVKALIDVPLQTIGGFMDTLQQGVNIVDAAVDWGLPAWGVMDGEWITPWSPDDVKTEYFKRTGVQLPVVPEGHSAIAPLYRGVIRLLTGFKAVDKALKFAKLGAAATRFAPGISAGTQRMVQLAQGVRHGPAAMRVATRYAKWGLADVVTWGEHEERLADFMHEFPMFQGDITEYLKSDMTDSMLEGKLKQALEGVVAGGTLELGARAIQLAVKAVSAMRAGRVARKELEKTGEIKILNAEAEDLAADVGSLGGREEKTVTFTVESMEEALGRNIEDLKAGPLDAATEAVTKPVLKPDPGAAVEKIRPNFGAIDGEADIDEALKLMEENTKKQVARAKGGTISHLTQREMGQDLGIRELMEMPPGRYEPHELLALSDFTIEAKRMMMEAAWTARRTPTAGNRFNLQKMMLIYQTVSERLGVGATGAGRTLGVLGAISKAGNVERIAMIDDVLFGFGNTKDLDELARRLTSTDLPDEALGKVVGSWQLRLGRSLAYLWKMSLVSGPITHMKNIGSNALFIPLTVLEREVAARIPGSTTEKGAAVAALRGIQFGSRLAVNAAGKTARTGVTGSAMRRLDVGYVRPTDTAITGWTGRAGQALEGTGKAAGMVGRALGVEDEFFKTTNFFVSLSMDAADAGIKRGLKGQELDDFILDTLQNPPEQMRIRAREVADLNTFMTKLDPALGGRLIKAARAYPPLQFLVPFITTSGNLAKRGLERGPLALGMKKSYWDEIKKGGINRDLAHARLATGSVMAAMVADLTMRGLSTGNGPTDPAERANWLRTNQPASVKIGDKWYQTRAIEPFGSNIVFIANATEKFMELRAYADSDDPADIEDWNKMFFSTVGAFGSALTNPTFLRSVNEFFVAMSDPDMHAKRWVLNYVRTAVPRGVAAVTKELDPNFKDANTALDKLLAEIPYFSEGIYNIRDWNGEVRKRRERVGDDYYIGWLSPIHVYDPKTAPANYLAFTEQKFRVRKPRRRQQFDSDPQGPGRGQAASIDMTQHPEVWDEFQQLVGFKLKDPDLFDGLGKKELEIAIVTGNHPYSEIWDGAADGDDPDISNDKGALIRAIANAYKRFARHKMMTDPQYDDDEAFQKFRAAVEKRAAYKMGKRLSAAGLAGEGHGGRELRIDVFPPRRNE